MEQVGIKVLEGRTLTAITQHEDETLVFTDTSGSSWEMSHCQDCCEYVYLDDVVGDLNDLIGSPILFAEERSSDKYEPGDDPVPDGAESYTWTFYRLSTIKGTVTLRWLGSSNGYYSESVYFEEIS